MVSGIDLESQVVGLQRYAMESAWQDMFFEQCTVRAGRDAACVGSQSALLSAVPEDPDEN